MGSIGTVIRRRRCQSDVFDDFSGLEAFRADFHRLDRSLDLGLDLHEVRQPGSSGAILGVGNIIAKHGTLAAHFTYSRHSWTPYEIVRVLYRKKSGM